MTVVRVVLKALEKDGWVLKGKKEHMPYTKKTEKPALYLFISEISLKVRF